MPQTTEIIELGSPCLGEAEKRAVCEVIDSGWITMGERVRNFEQAFARMHEAEEAIAVNSATAALQLSLEAFGIGRGDEVLVPSLTFTATSNVIVHAGSTPVFADIESPLRPHLSIEDAERRLTRRTRAILVVHFAGYLMDLGPWRDFADRHGLLLFEDSAHAAGMADAAGRLSDAASFSFFANKNMTTAEGGMLVIRDPDKRQRARLLRSHGMTSTTLDRVKGRATSYDVVACGHNFRMDELRAAIGLVQIGHLAEWNERRRQLTTHYRSEMARWAPEVEIPYNTDWPTSAHILPVLLPKGADRERVMANLKEEGIQSSVHYPPIHQFDYYRRRFGDLSLPATEEFSRRELTLPLHPRLTGEQVERVVATVAATVRRQ